jgi:ParB family chromosome partitioning protein
LIRGLGTKVRIINKGKKGKIEIEYYSLEELDRLLDILLG